MAKSGRDLEQAFASFLKEEQDYSVELNKIVKGKVANRGHEIDVYGRRKVVDPVYDTLFKVGISFTIFLVLLILLDEAVADEISGALVGSFIPELAAYGSLILLLILLTISKFARDRNSVTEYCWVECKDLSTNVKRDHINKLATSVEDFSSLKENDWKPTHIMFVSGKGFDSDAIAFAKHHGFIPYKKSGESFVKVLH